METLTAQAILVLLLVFAMVKTFWPGHASEGSAGA